MPPVLPIETPVTVSNAVTISFKFCAAHRLLHHPGKCNRLHGHNYRVDVTVVGRIDPTTGMVADFALVKEIIGGWVDKEWDHKTILNAQDPMLYQNGNGQSWSVEVLNRVYGHVPFALPVEPTAENMAKFLATMNWFRDYPALRGRVHVRDVTVFETDTCSATCSLECVR